MMSSEEGEFRTHDLGQAAYVQASGFPLKRLERDGPRRFVFVFEARAARVAEGFFQNDPIRAWDFFNAVRCLKARIRNEKGCTR